LNAHPGVSYFFIIVIGTVVYTTGNFVVKMQTNRRLVRLVFIMCLVFMMCLMWFGFYDVSGFYDENCIFLDITECKRGLHNCTQRCIELIGGYVCACNKGYELEDDGQSCKGVPHARILYRLYNYYLSLDIDECSLGISRCNQNCINTIGSYECYCYTGYQLLSDGFTCNGKCVPTIYM